jgi:hypothetical protein
LPTNYEKPRLEILQRFKEINKVIRTNYLKYANYSPLQREGLPQEQKDLIGQTEHLTDVITHAMKDI